MRVARRVPSPRLVSGSGNDLRVAAGNSLFKCLATILSFAAIAAGALAKAPDDHRRFLGKSKLTTLLVESWKFVGAKECGFKGAVVSEYQVTMVVTASLAETTEKKIVVTVQRAEPEQNPGAASPNRARRLDPAVLLGMQDAHFDQMGYPNWFPLRRGATLIAAYDGPTPSVADMEFLPDDKQYPPAAVWRDCKRFQAALKAVQESNASLDAALAKQIGAAENPPGYALFRLASQYDPKSADGPEFCRATAVYLANRRIPLGVRAAVPPELWSGGAPCGRFPATPAGRPFQTPGGSEGFRSRCALIFPNW